MDEMAHFDHEVARVRRTRAKAREVSMRLGRFITREATGVCMRQNPSIARTLEKELYWLTGFHTNHSLT
jgi:hypothetical protein